MAFTLKSKKVVVALVTTVVQHVQAADPLVHEAAVQTAAHAEKHGDWTLIHRLMVGLKNSGYRFQGVRVWIEAFTPLRFPADKNSDGGFTVKVLKPGDDGYTPWNIEGMNDTPFTAFEPANERVGKPIYADDFVKGIFGAKDRFLRLLENTNSDGTPRDPAKPYYRGDVPKMLAFIGQLEGLNRPEDATKAEDEKRAQREAETAVIESVTGKRSKPAPAAGTPVDGAESQAAAA